MRIELFGPSGAGKTTILSAAMAARHDNAWFGPDDIAPLVEGHPPLDESRAAIDASALREFIRWYTNALAANSMAPSRKITTLQVLARSCLTADQVSRLELGCPIVHDELLLHRSCSLLPRSEHVRADTHSYFDLVPVPDAAVIVTTEPEIILGRVRARERTPNVYVDLDDHELLDVLAKTNEMCAIAAEVLRSRGVRVLTLDTSSDVDSCAARLDQFVRASSNPVSPDDLRERLLLASGSFRKLAGRHTLRHQGVMYCAFSTPAFTVGPEESQRDAAKRVAAFGLDDDVVGGKTVLDLGSNAGAMLFQLSNHGFVAGLGIEYDADKVELAQEINSLIGVPNLRFEQGDIDKLDAREVGVHDIVLALAIEAHVQDPPRLYELLGEVTGDLLCFEGNSGCDMDEVRERLRVVGFNKFTDLGFCSDDIDPRNNKRPQMLAHKSRSRSGRFWSTVAKT